ncbi:Protein argonaute [Hypsizygus marmoreus]|uniref:Protein argonaute n=1 Tax=Hypsizygus marmoreus TaxID=39966 RepID=A0A369JH12_HYPMA|nr:Protein argonaute [Hypsizygus marmoreus]
MSRPQTRGKPVNVITNSFEITRLPTKEYIQYDVGTWRFITPELGKSLARKRQEIIHKLQTLIAPEIFSPRAIYDGRAILYASRPLKLPSGDGGSFTVSLTAAPPAPGARGSYEVKLTKTIGASVDATDMMRLVKGRTADNQTTMATNLLQLLVRQAPNQKYAHNGRAYFTPEGSKNIGSGLELWRGYFQSVRPTIDRMLVNVDTTITAVYAKGDLITVCLLFLNKGNDVRLLTGDERDENFRALEKHLHNLLINVVTTGNRTKAIRGLVPSAGKYEFSKDDRVTTIEEHYKEAHNRTIKHPNAFGVRLTKPNAPFQVIVPAELCTIIPGQLYRKRIPDHLTKAVVDFATVKPNDRLRQIQTGDGAMESPVKGYKNSEFILEAGMTIETRPITIKGRILDTPSLRYGGDREVKPRDGSWNVKGQQF